MSAGSNPPLRVALYGRVSVERGDQPSRSVDGQLDLGRDWVTRHGHRLVGVYRDDGISASRYARRKDRPDWQRLMGDVTAGEIDALWVWEISRATRDRAPWAALLAVCQDQQVRLIVDGREHDPNDPDDAFVLDLQASLAVRESAVTARRVRRGVATRQAVGRPHGRVAYGYRPVYDLATGEPTGRVPDPDTAPVVVEIVRRVLAGETLYAIARDLEHRRVPSPHAYRLARQGRDTTTARGWTLELVSDLARSPTYAGLRTHRGRVIGEGTWPALISAEDHAAVVDRHSRRRTGQDNTARYLLSGIAECGVCGAPCRMTRNRGYPSYACHGPDRRGDSCVTRRQPPVDAYVEEWLLRELEDPAFGGVWAEDDDPAGAARAEVRDLEARLAEYESAAGGAAGMAAASFARVVHQLSGRLAAARERAVPRGLSATVTTLAGPQARQRWAELDMAQRRQVVRELVRVVIHPSPRRRGAHGFDPQAVEIVRRC